MIGVYEYGKGLLTVVMSVQFLFVSVYGKGSPGLTCDIDEYVFCLFCG